jgi:hypothetical protein
MTTYRVRRLALAGLVAATAVLAGCAAEQGDVAAGGSPSAGTLATGGTATAGGSRVEAAQSSTVVDGATAPIGATTPPPAPTNPPVVSADGPATTIPDPNTTLPPTVPTEPPTIPASGDDPAMLDCGTLYRAAGWPTTFAMFPGAFSCLADAFTAGTPARLVDREQTDGYGGAILITTYDVLGPGQLRVTVDATQAADRPQVVTVSRCTGVVAEMQALVTSGCTVVDG